MREKCVCGFSTVDNISLLNIEGTGMIGVPGIAQRLFGAFTDLYLMVAQTLYHLLCYDTYFVKPIILMLIEFTIL